MHRVAKRIEDGSDLGIDLRIVSPDIGHRENDELGEAARTAHSDSLGVRAQVAAAGQAVAATSASHVPFTADQFSGPVIVHVRSDGHNFADEFVSDDERHRNCGLRPVVPLVNVEIGPTNPGKMHANLNVVDSNFRFRNGL